MLLPDTNTLLSSHKANPLAQRNFLIQFQTRAHFKWLLHATASANTQNASRRKKYAPRSLWCWCAYKILRNRSQPAVNSLLLFPERSGICRSHFSRRVLDFSEVLIQLLNHQIIPLFFSQITRSQVMFASLCHGRLAQYCCMVCPRFFVSVFSFVIVLVFVRFSTVIFIFISFSFFKLL